MKRILHLTLKKKWFDLTVTGLKPYEYREYKKHWIDRFMFKVGARLWFKVFDEIRYVNGYGNNRPFCRVNWDEPAIIPGNLTKSSKHHPRRLSKYYPRNGEILDPNKYYFAIKNGEVLEVGNVSQ